MPNISLATIVRHCDQILRTKEIGDYDGAVNGLQVENSGAVTRIAASVDASLATVKLAIAAKADLLIVHHGLFWSPSHPLTGKKYELLRLLIENNLAVYSSHLPLDAHSKLGNNAQLAASLGLKNLKPFFASHGQTIGFKSPTKISPAPLLARVFMAGCSGHVWTTIRLERSTTTRSVYRKPSFTNPKSAGRPFRREICSDHIVSPESGLSAAMPS